MKKTIGQFLKEKRVQAKKTQAELASALGYNTPQFISIMERDLAPMPLSCVDKIAEVLNFNPNPLKKQVEIEKIKSYRQRSERKKIV